MTDDQGTVALSPGARLGPYEIDSLIGAGGMGEVYKARDTRLDRIVALKLLPSELADRPDRRRRFESEARAISSLSHPYICALYDVGEVDGQAFLVMEHLDGETLEDRLTRGPLSSAEVLRWGAHIADALDHAHRAHIVHRDLKPSNVMLTRSGLKVLDFGLAKRSDADEQGAVTTASFGERKITAEGALIGTLPYMAPEQLEGRPVDGRTDVFAFGALLYEMATGRKAFDGTSQASLIASILTAQPPSLSATRRANEADALPQALDRVVERCLAKNPEERWQAARDLKAQLEWIREGGSSGTATTHRRTRPAIRTLLPWAVTAAVILVAASWIWLGNRPQAAEATMFVPALPPGTTLANERPSTRLAVSPDGRHLAYIGTTEGRERLWVQSFGSVTPRRLDGTDGAVSPFWSPDSQSIGFSAPGEKALKRVEASGGPPQVICEAETFGQGVWSVDGSILFSQFRQGIYRVSAAGGTPAPVSRVNPESEINHSWPSPLPDGRHYLYTATTLDGSGTRATPIVYVASLESNERHEVARMHSRMVYTQPGYVLFVHEGALFAQPFDVKKLQLAGEPRRIADGVGYYRSNANAAFSVSGTGVLAYHGAAAGPFQLAWFDRHGKARASVGDPQHFGQLRISPDGDRAAAEVIDPRLGTSDLWIYELTRGGFATRLTTNLYDESSPVWSPDGGRLLFGSDRGVRGDATMDVFVKELNGMKDEEVFFDRVGFEAPTDWSRDGRVVALMEDSATTRNNVMMLPLVGERKLWSFQASRFEEGGARFSPDSAWVAFVSNESGTLEVYVAPAQGSGSKTLVSIGGGFSARWRRDGKELLYVSGDGRSIMAASVELTPRLTLGQPQRLFTLSAPVSSRGRARNATFDVSPDGQQFLIAVPVSLTSAPRITVVLNWTSLLTQQ